MVVGEGYHVSARPRHPKVPGTRGAGHVGVDILEVEARLHARQVVRRRGLVDHHDLGA